MKTICIDILEHVRAKPGLSIGKIGIELSGKWGSSYTRMTTSELIHQGLILSDQSGKRGFSLTISEAGIQALRAVNATVMS
jgi:predicted transcriptional regulator